MARRAVASEPYTGTGALSGDWTVNLNNVTRANDHGNGSTGSRTNQADWTGDAFADDQYALAECIGLASYADYTLVSVRGSVSGGWYGYAGTTDGVAGTPQHCGILEYSNHADADSDEVWLTDINQDYNNTDYIMIIVEGTSLTLWRSTDGGATYSQVSSTTDATLTAGDAGGGTWGAGEDIDNWEGGDVVSGVILRRRIEGC